MDWTAIVVAVVTAIGSFLGVYFANRKSSALVEYRLEQLEKKVSAHNNLVERMYHAEEQISLHDAEFKRINHRLEDVEKGA